MNRKGPSQSQGSPASGEHFEPGEEPGRWRNQLAFPVLLIFAFIEGAAVMVVELTAARLMTPYFGQSVFVWTNIIGVVLAAVALGNYLGGHLADRVNSLLPLFILLSLAGTFCLIAPFLMQATATFFLGETLQLEEAFFLLVRGSFATALLLFAPPVLLAGACLPFLVKAASEVCGKVGRASGSIYGSSTLGSIAGTFLATYLFIEWLGSSVTFYLTGLTLVLLSGIGILLIARKNQGRTLAGLLLLATVGWACWGGQPARKIFSDAQVIHEQESRYQFIRVVETEEKPRTLHLCLNEGLDSFHSIYVEGQVLTGGQYYDYYCLLPALAGLNRVESVCIIGLAAGTTARQYQHYFGEHAGFHMDGVELDGETVEAGRKFMDLDSVSQSLTTYLDCDGRIFLQGTPHSYDVIIVDAYSKQIYIPFHIATREYFALVHARLKQGGVMGINVNGFSHDDTLVTTIANTAAAVFKEVWVARIPQGRNFMIYGVKGESCPAPDKIPRTALHPDLVQLLDRISEFGITREKSHDPSGTVLTDDWAPIELLCDNDLIRRSENLLTQIRDEP